MSNAQAPELLHITNDIDTEAPIINNVLVGFDEDRQALFVKVDATDNLSGLTKAELTIIDVNDYNSFYRSFLQ